MASINRVVKVLILSDMALITGLGFLAPIFAVFLTERIQGGDLKVIGYAAAVYWIIKSLAIIPIGSFLDRTDGERDDLWFAVIGNLMAAFAILGYLFASYPWHIYVLEAIYALGMAMNVPGYTAIFTRHIDKGREAYSWSLHSALVGLGAGVSGALGGLIAYYLGFNILIAGVFVFILISSFLPLFIKKEMSPRHEKIPRPLIDLKDIQTPR